MTLAKTESNNDFGNQSGFGAAAMNKYRQSQEYGVASSDQVYNTKLSGTYELPIGSGKLLLNRKGIANAIVGGWQIGGILDYEGGTPYSVSQTGYAFQPNE